MELIIEKAELIERGRHETWRITTKQNIDEIPKEKQYQALLRVSFLWQTTITKINERTLIYEGWTD